MRELTTAEIQEGQFRPEEILREMYPPADHVTSPPQDESDIPAELMGTAGMLSNASSESDTSVRVGDRPEVHRASLPNLQEDVKPTLTVIGTAKPEPIVDIKPVIPDTWGALEQDNEQDYLEEEEDYDEDDIVVVPWLNSSFQAEVKARVPIVKPEPSADFKPTIRHITGDVKPDIKESFDSSEIEEQEEYSEDELFECE